MSAPGPADRSKRHKGEGPMGGPPPPDGYHGYGQPGRYQQPGYGPGGPPMGPQSGYMWQHNQYGNHPHPPPHSWGHGSPPPPGSMYGQRGGPGPSMTPDRGGYGSAYPRGPPPMQGPGGPRRGGKPASRPGSKNPDGGPPGPPGPPDGPPPQAAYQGGWGHPQGGQWPQHQWSSGPTPVWQGNAPPMHQPPPSYGGPGMYSGATSPPRPSQGRPRASPEMIGGYAGAPPSSMCQQVENPDMDMYHSRGVGPPHNDDDNGSTMGGNSSMKDKGRGSYKCGRCGVPKKGHVCPYQPKLTRRPGEPLPEMRSAAIQVEMDEFMTLRRLNLKIQGFPESYATEPYMDDDMVVGEPHPSHAPVSSSSPPSGGVVSRSEMMTVPDSGPSQLALPSQDSMGVLGSPIRSSPITEDPITGAA